MPEAGGSATQAGVFYQNSVAALMLVDLLDFDPLPARERVIEVQVEAPEDVDDIVIGYADGHRQYMSVKLSLTMNSSGWAQLWASFKAQHLSTHTDSDDPLTIVVGDSSGDSQALKGLCERSSSSLNEQELRGRLTQRQMTIFDNIVEIVEPETAFELLRRTSVRHLTELEIVNEIGRRRLAGGQTTPPQLLSTLRDIIGGQARRRGLFRAAPLRRKLKLEYNIELSEPPEWGLTSYRALVSRLSRIEVPGTGLSGSANELFVWPRLRERNRNIRPDFEDENPMPREVAREETVDLRFFPSEGLGRVVIAAGPGYGKPALLTAVADRLAPGPFVPVTIPLASLGADDTSVLEFLARNINLEMDLRADWQLLAEQGLLTLLLDGLDEVPAAIRPMLMKRIYTFSARYPRAPWILTVRDPMVVTGLPEARVLELLPLNEEDIERFAETIGRHVCAVDSRSLMDRLRLHPDLDRLARIPLFLVMLLVADDAGHKPQLTRSDLIESYLKTLFSPAEHKPSQHLRIRATELRFIAETLAFERLERQEIGATEREVREVINRLEGSPEEHQLLFEQMSTNGILKKQSPIRLQFPYPIVQEYLAAQHLVERYPESIGKRIDDAIQRPWAQVIQFALEKHPSPESIIRTMLDRPDDAFCTGLRLIGRCIANGASVSDPIRHEVGERLVAYWIGAPSESRALVGRLLAEGFSSTPLPSLYEALHHRWLLNSGAGEVISRLDDVELTLSVLRKLMKHDRDSMMIYHALRPAVNSAGDMALRAIIDELKSGIDEDSQVCISSLLSNFDTTAVSQELVLSLARDSTLPSQARMRAYALAAIALDDEAIALMMASFKAADWDQHYEARDMVQLHESPTSLLAELFLDESIPIDRRQGLASNIAQVLPNAQARRAFSCDCARRSEVALEIRLTLQLVEARFGDRSAFEELISGIDVNPISFVGITVSLFGHFQDRELAERAASYARQRGLTPIEIVELAQNVSTGMLYVFEMDYGLSGALRQVALHPGISAWVQLIEYWIEGFNAGPRDNAILLTAAAAIGSHRARVALEAMVFTIENMDAPEWTDDDEVGLTLSYALYEIQRSKPVLPLPVVDRLLASRRYNIASRGLAALEALGNEDALNRLLDFHRLASDWHLRDAASNALEAMAAKRGVQLREDANGYSVIRVN